MSKKTARAPMYFIGMAGASVIHDPPRANTAQSSAKVTRAPMHFMGMGGSTVIHDPPRASTAQSSAEVTRASMHFMSMGGSTVIHDPPRANVARPSADTLPCPAWVYATGSNTQKSSAAKDRSWFGADYRPISSTLTSGAPVIGIGTVHLPVKTKPDARHREHGTITLRNVLHVPSALSNIVGVPIMDDYQVSLAGGPGSKGSISLRDGTPVGFFAPGRLFWEVRLSGPPIGPRVGSSPFEPGCHYWVNARWDEPERDKWLRAPLAASAVAAKAPPTPAQPSEGEKEWLKRHYGSEFKFLRQHGLSIYKDEDREEGWQIMRALMAPDDEEPLGSRFQHLSGRFNASELQWLKDHFGTLESFIEEHGRDPANRMHVEEAIRHLHDEKNGLDESDDADDSDLDWDNGAPETLLCNSHFGRDELKWVKANFGDARSFMVSMGLQFHEADDGQKASEMARRFMAD